MHLNDPVDFMPEEPSAPWWLEDIEDYLELLHGDADSLCEQHGVDHQQKTRSSPNTPPHPRQCPACKTVFHLTKRGGNDSCPFCRSPLNFLIA